VPASSACAIRASLTDHKAKAGCGDYARTPRAFGLWRRFGGSLLWRARTNDNNCGPLPRVNVRGMLGPFSDLCGRSLPKWPMYGSSWLSTGFGPSLPARRRSWPCKCRQRH
jgi:hypothetical protein